MECFAATDIGRVRKINEDAFYNDPDNLGLYIVADGMGGHLAGEVASALAVDTLSSLLREPLKKGGLRKRQIEELLRDAVVETNRTIHRQATAHEGLSGMGTTVVVCVLAEGRAHIAHIGDSRAYLAREGQLVQLTTDHSLVQELLSKGRITEAEAVDHPRKNILTRALGTDPDVAVDLTDLSLKAGDVLLLCTDGVTNHVEASELLAFLTENTPQEAGRKMIELANSRGGFDNMTVLIVNTPSGQEDRA